MRGQLQHTGADGCGAARLQYMETTNELLNL
jgi:hypothetical protein